MEDRTRMPFDDSAADSGKESQVYKTSDKVNSSEVQRAAADETTAALGSGEGSGSGAISNQNVMNGKKRGRGRPRKHEAVSNVRSSEAFQQPTTAKPSRGRPKGTAKFQALASNGGFLGIAVGAFTTHVVEGFAGEDLVSKIKSLSLKGPRSVCVLTATGAVSSVTIFRAGSAGTFTYEGWFEILTLTGSFVVTYNDAGAPCYKNWNLSVSLADCSGRVFGGKLAGPLIAAGPGSIQLILGSFKQNIGRDVKKKYSSGRSTSTNHFACSTMLPSQVSGVASPAAPHIVIKSDPLKLAPLRSDNIVGENRTFNSTSLESVGPNNLQKADAVIAENHGFNSLKGVGPNSLYRADVMEANNVAAEINDLNSSSLKNVASNNSLNLPVSQPKSDEMITAGTNARALEMHVKD